MPVIHGRLVCVICGHDLGDASDPYRDPTCGVCLDREAAADAEYQTQLDEELRELEWRREHDKYQF